MTALSFQEVSEILSMIERLDCDSLTLEYGDLKLSVRRGEVQAAEHLAETENAQAGRRSGAHATPPAPGGSAPAPATTEAPREPDEIPAHWEAVRAPMAGTFYRASSPDEPPLVQVRDRVDAGQAVGLIEVMKLFNELRADQPGTVMRIEADNSAFVEYDEPLVWIEPS